MRSPVISFVAALCMALGCALSLAPVANGQIRITTAETPKLESSVHPEDLIATTIGLNLCVDGSAQYPCPANILSDGNYIPAITLTYGQILDGVVTYGADGAPLTSGTITIYKASPPSNVRIAVCTLRIGIDKACPADSTIFDVGDYTLSATLTFPPGSPYANFDTSVGPCSTTPTCDVIVAVAKDPTSIALTNAPNPAALGTSVTFTAVVSGTYPATPTDQVVFTLDNSQLPPVTLDATGTARFTTSTLGLGQHTMTASYAGATDFISATDVEKTQVIVPPDTITTIASSLNPSNVGDNVTFTASVATASLLGVTPTGAVTFKDGTASFATVLVAPKGVQNIAQTTISTLGAGTHSITAIYSGDAATSASVSPVLVQQVDYPLTVPPPGYTITVTPSSVSMAAGLTTNLVVTVTPVSGFLGAVTLSCSKLPNESACTFGETTIPVGGGTTSLALSTMSPHDCGSNVPYGGYGALNPPSSGFGMGKALGYSGSALAGVFLLLGPRRRRHRRGVWLKFLLTLIVFCEIAGLSGCGGNCTDFGTPPGHYTIKVNGVVANTTPVTAGSTPTANGTATPNVTANVALTVKP